MAGTLTPTPYQTVLDGDGVAVSGAKIHTYEAGTTTNATTYTTSDLSVANANPIVADSAGRYVAYLSAGANMRFIIKTSADVTIDDQDNVQSVPGSSVNLDLEGTVGEAVTAGQVVYMSSAAEATPLTAGLWYLTDADAAPTSTTAQTIGVAVSAIAINAAGTIRLAGLVTTAGAVVVGTTYYVSTTAGALASSAPTLSRQVGVAMTTSSLLLAAGTRIVGSIPNPITQDLLFTDNTYDIGKSGATRPRDGFFSRNAVVGGTLGVSGISTFTADLVATTASMSFQDAEGVVLGTGSDATIKYDGTNVSLDSQAVGSGLLVVTGSAAISGVEIDNTATDGDPTLAFTLSGTSLFTMGVDDGDSDKFKIGTTAIGTNTALTIDGSQDIGIGTDAPQAKLHILSASAGTHTPHGSADELVIEGSGSTGLTIVTPDANSGAVFWSSPSRTGDIGARVQFNYDDNLMTIGQIAGGAVITLKAANTGIGTLAPTVPLEASGSLSSNGTEEVLRISGNTGVTSAATLRATATYAASAGARYFGLDSLDEQDQAAPLVLNAIGGGNVGINVVAPDYTFDVDLGNSSAQFRSTNANGLLVIENDADTDPAALSLAKSRGSYASPGDVVDGDAIGRIRSKAWSGSAYWGTASIEFQVDGTVSSNQRPPSNIVFYTNISNTATASRMSIAASGTVDVVGTFTAGTKTFRIPHPLPELKATHYLIHGCLEGPRLDLIYRSTVTLVDGAATVDLDDAAGMSAGTWVLLCRDAQVFTTNETGWFHVRGTVSGSTLTIECEEGTCTDTVSWMVVAERQDDAIKAQSSTDEDGHLIIEPLQVEEEPDPEEDDDDDEPA